MSSKSLSFSLDDIKKQHLISLKTPTDVANALIEQANDVHPKRVQLTASLTTLEQ